MLDWEPCPRLIIKDTTAEGARWEALNIWGQDITDLPANDDVDMLIVMHKDETDLFIQQAV